MKMGLLLLSLLSTGVLLLALLAVAQGLSASPIMNFIPPSEALSNNTSSPPRYNLNIGAVFNISCRITHSSDAFTLYFYKDGVVIGNGDLVNTTLTVTNLSSLQQSIQLQFLNFQPVHDGVYHCSANTSDTNETATSDLYLYGSELPPPTVVRVSSRYVVLNTSVDLVLDARFRGNFFINDWVYSENDLSLQGFSYTLFKNATMTNVGQTYTIPAGSDSIKAGYYGPRIILTPSDSGSVHNVFPTFENVVIVGSFIAPTAFINGVETAQVTAMAGDNVTFTCLARGFPETTLNIQLSGVTASYTIGNQTLMTEATPTSFMEVTRTVTLHNVTALDSGAVVTCVASNMNSDGSTHTDQAAATLLAQVAPNVTNISTNQVVTSPDPVSFNCTVDSYPSSNITWLHNGAVVQAAPPRVTISTVQVDSRTQESTLTLLNTTAEDIGTYTCSAVNTEGSDSMTTELQVLVAPEVAILATQKPTVTVSEGGNEVVMCTATGVPLPTISWFMNGVLLADGDSSETPNTTTFRVTSNLMLINVMRESAFATVTCNASNGVGANSSDSTQLIVQFAPNVTAISGDQVVTSPDPVSFNCTVDSYPSSNITWLHNGAEVQAAPPRVTISTVQVDSRTQESTLTLLSTTSEDIGTYTCSAVNEVGSTNMTTELRVLVFPEVNITEETVVVNETNPAVLTCVSTGIPEPNNTWMVAPSFFMSGGGGANMMEPIDSDGINFNISSTTRVLGSQNIEVTSTLTVYNTAMESTGVYTCVAMNSLGTVMDTAELIVQFGPTVGNISQDQVAVSPDPVQIFCFTAGYPRPTIMWFLNGQPVTANENVTIDTIVSPLENTTLGLGLVTGILRLNVTRPSDAGVYECVSSNLLGNATNTTNLTVHFRAEIDVSTFQELYVVNEGQNVTFSCSAFGVPAPSLSWRRDGVELSPSSDSRVVLLPEVTTQVDYMGPVYQTTRMLTFTNVTDNDTRNTPGDMYQCVAVNTVGSGNNTKAIGNFSLFVRVAPTFIQELDPTNVTFRANLVLTCIATASPLPNITWYKDGVELMMGGQVSVTSGEVGERVLESTLNVLSPFLEGIGTYTCVAENVVDTANSTAEVVVFFQPFIRDPPVNLTVNQSSPATFSCTAQGNPVPTISWTGPSANFTTEDTPGANFTVSSVLTIDSAVRALHEGVYTCNASNGVGPSATNSSTLTVQVPPTVEAVQERIVGIQEMSVTVSFVILDASPEVQTQNIRWTFTDLNGNSFNIPTDSSMMANFSTNLTGVFTGDQLNLTLSGLNNAFEGTYTMMATNEAGSDSSEVVLVIEGPPRIIRSPSDQEVMNGVDVTFDCLALAEPLHSLTWYYFGGNGINATIGSVNGTEKMIMDNETYQITDSMTLSTYGSLVVRDVQFEDRGVYMCLAENRHGSEAASATLAVQVPPMFLSTSPQVDIIINSTDNVTLNCSLQGYPISDVQWMKDRTPLTPDGSHITITTFRRQGPTDTYPFSSIQDSNFEPIPQEGLEYFEAVSELTLVPPLLRTDTANYTCVVKAQFVQNYTETSDNIPVFILEVPDAPVNVTITNNTQRSQVLSWVVPFDGNRPVTQNIIYFTSSRQSTLTLTQIYPPLGGGKTKRQTSGVSTDPLPSVTTTDNPTTVIVSNLIPFVAYSYTVVAVNELGRSDMSQPSPSVQTEAAAPDSSPRGCVALANSSTSFGVAWSSPDPPNGIIANYTIVYRPVDAVANYDPSTLENSTTNYTDADTTMLMAVNLQSAVLYSIQLAATNQIGTSPFTPDLECTVLTEDDVPGVPQNVNVISPNSTSLLVTWDHPLAPDRNGVITGYTVIRQSGSERDTAELFNNDTSHLLTGLVPFTEYNITVAGNTSAGQGEFTMPFIMRTLNDTASEPLCPALSNPTINSVVVSWYPPGDPKGVITDYEIYLSGTRHYNTTFSDSRTERMKDLNCGVCSNPPSCDEPSAQADQCIMCTVPGLAPATNYTVSVAALSEAGTGEVSVNMTAETMVSNPPDPPPITPVPPVTADPTPSTGLTIIVPIVKCTQENGPISHYQIVVVAYRLGAVFDTTRRPNDVFENENRFVPYEMATFQDELVYVAAEFAAWRFPGNSMFTLGSGGPNDKEDTYTNPTLSFSTSYTYFIICFPDTTPESLNDSVKVRVTDYSLAGYSSFGGVYVTPDAPTDLTPAIAGGVIVAIFLIVAFAVVIIIIFVVVRRRKSKYDVDYHGANGRGSVVPVFMSVDDEKETPFAREDVQPKKEIRLPVSLADLPQVLENLKRDDNRGFQVEYQSIKDNSPQHPVTNFKMPENKIKNRYGNIMCYDTTRVVLKNVGDNPGADYINASHIAGYNRENEYIASQGPLPSTLGDFWRMVWEQNAQTIVMLTQVIEGTKIKCQQYWPTNGEATFGSFVVSVVETNTYAQYTARTIEYHPVEEPANVKTVKQFHFTSWPDFGVPLNGAPLLKFLTQIRKHHDYSNPRPLLVHCSAGVGRTGTLIGLDVELQRATREGVVDPYNFVLHMRDQRNLMVQTENQYIFLYETIMEGITHDFDEFPISSLKERLVMLHDFDEDGHSGVEREFKHLVSTAKVDIRQFSDANADANKFKNRFMNFLPYNFTRVSLDQQPGIEGSDYINASYIDGYREKNAFIATQGPLPDTVQDFWRMVWEKNTACVVMLTQLVENGIEMCSHYWPAAGEKKQCGKYLTVELTDERAYEDYVHRDFKITFTDEVLQASDSRNVSQFHFLAWPERGSPQTGAGMIDLIDQVRRVQMKTSNNAIIVHCSNGTGRTGAFIGLSVALEHVRTEGMVDVYGIVKNLRTQRPHMVQTLEQYTFCYSTIAEYIEAMSSYDNFQ